MRKILLLLFFIGINASVFAQQNYIQMQMQQECVSGKQKFDLHPITPNTNIGEFTFNISPITDNGYTATITRTGQPNEFFVDNPPINKHANFLIKVSRPGYSDISFKTYTTTCDHHGNPTNCPDNERTFTANKTYFKTGEAFRLDFNGCSKPISTGYITHFEGADEYRPDVGIHAGRLQIGAKQITGIVSNQPMIIAAFCGTQGECHGYTTYFMVPDGHTVRDLPFSGSVKLKNAGSNKYMSFNSGIRDNIIQQGGATDEWRFEKIEEPNVYRIIHQQSSKVLEATASWGAVSLRNQSSSEQQKWLVSFYEDGALRLRPKLFPNYIMSVESESDNENSSMYTSAGMPNRGIQYFKILAEAGGTPPPPPPPPPPPSTAVITTNNPAVGNYRPGETVATSFATNFAPNVNTTNDCGTFDKSIFELQLSDANGQFNAPLLLSTARINDDTGNSIGTFAISGAIPSGTPAGNGYRVRVVRMQAERNFTRTVSSTCSSTVPMVINSSPQVWGNQNPTAFNIIVDTSPPPPPPPPPPPSGCPDLVNESYTLEYGWQNFDKIAKNIVTISNVKNGAILTLRTSQSVEFQNGTDLKAEAGGYIEANLNGCR